MSIILDALRKAQLNLERNDERDVAKLYDKVTQQKILPVSLSIPPKELGSAKKNKMNHKTTIGLIGLLGCCVGLFLALILFLFKQSSRHQQPHAMSLSSYQSPLAVKKIYNENNLILKGTMMMGDKKVALINDDVYEIGDSINGQEILDITLDKVQLQDQGKVITLSVQ